jgi:hypothetical protein
MTELGDDLFSLEIQKAIAQGPFFKTQKEYHEQATLYIKEQLALVEDQKRYSKTIRTATVVMAIATAVYAAVAILQYVFPIK